MIGPINILLILIFLVVVPFFIGMLFESFYDKGTYTIMFSRCLVTGIAVMFAIFQLMAVPMIYKGTPFTSLLYPWVSTVIALCVLSIALNGKSLKGKFIGSYGRIVSTIKSFNTEQKALTVVAILLILFQTWILAFNMHTDTDDARFIAEALEAVENNTMLRLHPITGDVLESPYGEMNKDITSPFPILIGAFSYLTRVHPAVLSHVVFSLLLIPIAYAVAYMIGDCVLNDDKKIPYYMTILSIIVLFSFESIYSWGYTMLTIIWQGRSIAAVVMLPFLWYVLLKIYTNKECSPGIFIILLVTALANSVLSGMGGLMAPLIGGCFALSHWIKNKNIIQSVMIVACVLPSGLYSALYAKLSKILMYIWR